VLLNANVAFLAIQSVDSSGNAAKRSFVQRSSYCSIVASIGTIVIGLLLARQHHTKLDVSTPIIFLFSFWRILLTGFHR